MGECQGTCQYHQQIRSELNRVKEDCCKLQKNFKDDTTKLRDDVFAEIPSCERKVTGMFNTRFGIFLALFLTVLGSGWTWLSAMANGLSEHRVKSAEIHSANAHAVKANSHAIQSIEKIMPKIMEKLDAIHSEQIESRVEIMQIKRDIERYHGSTQ